MVQVGVTIRSPCEFILSEIFLVGAHIPLFFQQKYPTGWVSFIYMLSKTLKLKYALLSWVICLLALVLIVSGLRAQDIPSNTTPPVKPPSDRIELPLPPVNNKAEITYENADILGSIIKAQGVTVIIGEYTLSGAALDGDFDKELVFTGSPTLTYRGQKLNGKELHFFPKTKAFHFVELKTSLSPEFLQNRLLSPLFLDAQTLTGHRNGPYLAEQTDTTTCELPEPHYLLSARTLKLEPGKRLTFKKVTVLLWGHKLISLPTMIIPLDRQPRRFRVSHLPQFGHSEDEGWFAKSTYDYLLADRVPGIIHLDGMEKKGLGLGVEQGWNLARMTGLLALYTIPTGGSGKNLSGRVNHRQNIGGGQTLTFDGDYQQRSYLTLPQTTSLNTRLGYNLQLPALTTTFNISRQTNNSPGYSTQSWTANMAQGFRLGAKTDINLGTDYSKYANGGSFTTTSEQLNYNINASHRENNYSLQLVTNRQVPMGTGTSFFSGVQRVPELNLNNYRFTHGYLSTMPLTLSLSAGRYSEGSAFGAGQSSVTTERGVFQLELGDRAYQLSRRTDLHISGGFQQNLYTDGAAQYLVKNTTTLTQRWSNHSGVNFNYTYQRPEGGTPFLFDRLAQFHNITADVGFLDNQRIEFTARVGYDLSRNSFGGMSSQPWQTLSANLLLRPRSWIRFQNLFSFDPNTGKFISVDNDLRIRGHRDFQMDLVARYDPQQHKFGSINGYWSVPISTDWRLTGLCQYNGYLNRFESRNLQIVKDLHCMEASLSYTENPYGFRNDRQIWFQLRIKAFPLYRMLGIGQFGQAIDTGIGGRN